MTATQASPLPGAISKPFRWAGYLLGFAMAGFFDGILLHQILQWHHLLSAVEGSAFRDLRVQVLADGLFHAAMYLVMAIGLWLLARGRSALAVPRAGQVLLATFLIGFGVWHIIDGLLFHWALGIHHIRMETDSVLLWDLIFFGLGIAVVAVGWRLRRDGGLGNRPATVSQWMIPFLLVVATLAAASVAALPSSGSTVTVLFKPGTRAPEAFAAVAAVDGRVISSHTSGDLWVIDIPETGKAWQLYRYGALFVSGTVLPAGCFSPQTL